MLDFLINGLCNATAWNIFIFTAIVTHITIVSVTIFLHRHQAHRALELHSIPSHFFRFWLWLTTGQVTKEWAAIHRKHHAKCETPDDPHSPVTRGIKKVLFQGAELYRVESHVKDTMRIYGHGTPSDWIEHNLYVRFQWQGIALMLIVDFILFGVIGVTVWAIQMMWIPVTAAGIINGIGHYWGYRNFESNDASRNIFPLGILIGGEELHNNHHTFGTSAKLSSKWYEFDIGWMYIRALEMMGLATVKKIAPFPKFKPVATALDFDTLQSVIANRYEVMSTYAASFKRTWTDELADIRRKSNLDPSALSSMKRLLHKDPGSLHPSQLKDLGDIFNHSNALKIMHEMRSELILIWGRSTNSSDQILQQLQDWCKRAESSGVKSLAEFSYRLRSYGGTT
jgi:stearoyl-CoA desaturase (delta-9 desaturase)